MRASTRRVGGAVGLLAAAGLLAAGCGPSYTCAPVEGKVTMGGRPLAGVRVWFYPVTTESDQPPYAMGTSDAAGVYTLKTVTGQPGALVGKNRVVVNWPLPERPGLGKPPPPPPGPPIPMAYTQAVDTPLIYDVKPGPKQIINVDLPGS